MGIAIRADAAAEIPSVPTTPVRGIGVVPRVKITEPVTPTGSVAVIVTLAPKMLGPEVATVITGVTLLALGLLTVCVVLPVIGLLFASPL